MTDQDSPWKEVLEQDLPLALAFFFPDEIYAHLDWSRDYEVLEQELRALFPSGPAGKRLADCLVKVHRKGGDDVWYLHGEVQGRKERAFRRRMHVYNSRAEERFGQPVGSFAVLTDGDPQWRPRRYKATVCGTTRLLHFPIVKVLDWQGREDELRSHPNPMALFVLAQLASTRSRKDWQGRAAAKLELILLLQQRNLDEEALRHWYRYLDWFLALPRRYDDRIWDQVNALTKEKVVPFVTYAERRGMEKGLEQGHQQGLQQGLAQGLTEGLFQGIEVVLELRFPEAAAALTPSVRRITDGERLRQLLSLARSAGLDEFRAAVEAAVAVLPG